MARGSFCAFFRINSSGDAMRYLVLTKRGLAILFSCVVIVAAAIGIASSTADRVTTAMTEPREIPIYYVDTDEKVCAISFDAAWGNEQTEALLDTLDQYKVHTTFFLVRQWVDKYPDSVRDIAARGHEIGNHSATHPHMAQLNSSEQLEEILSCNKAVEKLTGVCPRLFRAPYGEYDNKLIRNLRGKGMYCVQWNIDSLDWQDPSADEIVCRVGERLCPGSIILLHNGAANTPEALPKLIEMIRAKGYRIVPIGELIPDGDYYTDHEGKMILTDQNN